MDHQADFTEARYRELLELVIHHWRPVGYREGLVTTDTAIIWRHDVDFSMHRAARLATIEADAGIYATYFVWSHSDFYNLLEHDVMRCVRHIRDLGHRIGVHFDPTAWPAVNSPAELSRALAFERKLLEDLFEVDVEAFSYHNPTTTPNAFTTDEDVAGLVNAYCARLQARYKYVSDSNGYWRHDRLTDVLEAAAEPRLHVLTHPEWWTPTAMPPRERVTRSIEGRALAQHSRYDRLLDASGRVNVR